VAGFSLPSCSSPYKNTSVSKICIYLSPPVLIPSPRIAALFFFSAEGPSHTFPSPSPLSKQSPPDVYFPFFGERSFFPTRVPCPSNIPSCHNAGVISRDPVLFPPSVTFPNFPPLGVFPCTYFGILPRAYSLLGGFFLLRNQPRLLVNPLPSAVVPP